MTGEKENKNGIMERKRKRKQNDRNKKNPEENQNNHNHNQDQDQDQKNAVKEDKEKKSEGKTTKQEVTSEDNNKRKHKIVFPFGNYRNYYGYRVSILISFNIFINSNL
jgi:7SK snRNA methylphosphate capping enzyme